MKVQINRETGEMEEQKAAKIRISIPSFSDLIILPKDIRITDAFVDHDNWPDRMVNFIVEGKGLSNAFIRQEAMRVKEAIPRMGLYSHSQLAAAGIHDLVAIFGFEEFVP
jgi:hypothetical protein